MAQELWVISYKYVNLASMIVVAFKDMCCNHQIQIISSIKYAQEIWVISGVSDKGYKTDGVYNLALYSPKAIGHKDICCNRKSEIISCIKYALFRCLK